MMYTTDVFGTMQAVQGTVYMHYDFSHNTAMH